MEKELEHSSLQEKFDQELKELEKTLELKQVKNVTHDSICRFIEMVNPTY